MRAHDRPLVFPQDDHISNFISKTEFIFVLTEAVERNGSSRDETPKVLGE